MSMFRKAERRKAKLRLALIGPSGSGKTYSALLIALGMGGKIVVIDSENGSADLYSGIGEYDVYPMTKPYEPEKLIGVIKSAEQEGYTTIIIDSLTHYWAGEGGLLDRHGKIGGNSYTAWAKVTPVQQRMVDAINNSSCHIISTMRSKTEYALVEKNGKQVPEKIGMAPIQRDGTEYEYTVIFNLNMQHTADVSKDRTSMYDGRFITPNKETGKELIDWLETGADAITPTPQAVSQPVQLTKSTQPEQSGKPFLDDNKRKLLYARAAKECINEDNLHELVKFKFGIDTLDEIHADQFSALINNMQKLWLEYAAETKVG